MEKFESQLLAELILDVKKDVSEMRKDISEIRSVTKDNSSVLIEHMRRTEASEARLDVQEEKFEDFARSMDPVKEHVKTLHLLTDIGMKVLKVLGVLVSVFEAVKGLLKLR